VETNFGKTLRKYYFEKNKVYEKYEKIEKN